MGHGSDGKNRAIVVPKESVALYVCRLSGRRLWGMSELISLLAAPLNPEASHLPDLAAAGRRHRIGAGDCFAAGVIAGLLEGNFVRGLQYGVAMSALQLTTAGDLFRFSRGDVLELMASEGPMQLVR